MKNVIGKREIIQSVVSLTILILSCDIHILSFKGILHSMQNFIMDVWFIRNDRYLFKNQTLANYIVEKLKIWIFPCFVFLRRMGIESRTRKLTILKILRHFIILYGKLIFAPISKIKIRSSLIIILKFH